MSTSIHLIYAGGTFGCHGSPLAPLPADEFLPTFTTCLSTHQHTAFSILANNIIKDSSTLTPSDFVHFYEMIIKAHQAGARHFILLTGTDSLSFLGAFLSNALSHLEISLFITGSMHPLFEPQTMPYTINKHSDAWHNLSLCLQHMGKRGVFVALGDVFWADNTQKIHSQDNQAFVGQSILSPQKAITHTNTTLKRSPTNAHFKTIYLCPNDPSVLSRELDTHATAVILIAFGAGNVPSSPAIIDALSTLHAKGTPVVCTSMCAFGGVSSDYGAGAWQYEHGVWSGGDLTVAGIYGKLLWLYLTDNLTQEGWLS